MLLKLATVIAVIIVGLTAATNALANRASEQSEQSKYSPTIHDNYVLAKRTVNAIFPPGYQRALMLQVISCETGQTYNPYAKNPSGAMGFFQIMDGHNGTTYSFNGISVTVDKNRLFDPYYNTLVAYLMSHGGTKLSDWYASRGCWG